jgi:hypothetical protein
VNEPNTDSEVKDLQASALLASAAVFTGFAIYWWGEIQSVLEMLELAYG